MQMPPLAEPSKKPSQEEQSEIVKNQWGRYVRARDSGHLEYLKKAKKCDSYYRGDQWEVSDKLALESEGRPALTINMVLSTVNAVIGEHAANTVEFHFVPKAEGTEHTPNVMSKLAKAICDANQYTWKENEVFADGIIQDGRGYFDVRVDFDSNLMGEVKITTEDPTTVIIDPDASEYDPNTWGEVFKTTWLSLDQIEAMYGRPARERISSQALNGHSFGVDSVVWQDNKSTFGNTDEADFISQTQAISDEEQRTIKLVRVIERQHAKMHPTVEFVDLMTGDTKPVPPTWSDEKVQQAVMGYNLGLLKRVKRRIRWTVTADHELLHDDWSPYASFTKVPFFAYFRRGKPFGLVTNLLSPQEQLNKLASQELHIINTTANSGWVMWRGSLSGMTADELRNQGAETGIVLEVNPGHEAPQKIQPNKVPAGIERAALKSAEFIKEISGVNDAQLGFNSPEVSGVALKEAKGSAHVQMQVPFENMQRTRHLMARKILELVQQFYTEQRAFKVVTEGMGQSGKQLNEKDQEYIVNLQTATGEVLNDITVGKYEISLSVIPSRDSFQDQQFAEAINLRNVGVMVPDDRVIEYSHLAHKQELAEEVRELQGRGEMTEEQKQMMQFQQQIAMQMMQLEVAKAEADVRKVQAETAEKLAQIDPDSPEYELEREKLEVQIAIAREQLQLRRDMAELQSKTSLDTTLLQTRGKLAGDRGKAGVSLRQSREKNLTDLQKESMKLRQQSKGIDYPVRKGV